MQVSVSGQFALINSCGNRCNGHGQHTHFGNSDSGRRDFGAHTRSISSGLWSKILYMKKDSLAATETPVTA